MIHYNIGRFSNKETKLELPSKKDFIKNIYIIFIIIVSKTGVLNLQGFNKYI